MTEEMGKESFPVYEKAEFLKSLFENKFEHKKEILPQNSHAGLVFDRFPMIWWVPYGEGSTLDHGKWDTIKSYRSNGRNKKDKKEPLAYPFLKQFCEKYKNQKKAGETLLQWHHCRLAVICSIMSGTTHDFSCRWRFVAGLGASHPLGNGFTFDRSVGVPYLPGSSVKGVARAGAECLLTTDEKDLIAKEDIDRIFGPENTGDEMGQTPAPGNGNEVEQTPLNQNDENEEEKSKRRQTPSAGSVIFMDAYPVNWPKLEPDIMTPHYGDYYSEKSENLVYPSDHLEPNPIPFLTVAWNTKFRFMIIPRTQKTRRKDIDLALKSLFSGLSELGAGAKTGVGYGYFE